MLSLKVLLTLRELRNIRRGYLAYESVPRRSWRVFNKHASGVLLDGAIRDVAIGRHDGEDGRDVCNTTAHEIEFVQFMLENMDVALRHDCREHALELRSRADVHVDVIFRQFGEETEEILVRSPSGPSIACLKALRERTRNARMTNDLQRAIASHVSIYGARQRK